MYFAKTFHLCFSVFYFPANTVEEEVTIVYSALLSSCAKTEVCTQMKEMGAMDVAR